MSTLFNLDATEWDKAYSPAEQAQAVNALENGDVLYFPTLSFNLSNAEQRLLAPEIVGKRKSVSFDWKKGRVRGHRLPKSDGRLTDLKSMMARFSIQSRALLNQVLPHYSASLSQARTSFRPVEVAGRTTFWRKDDTPCMWIVFPHPPCKTNGFCAFLALLMSMESRVLGGLASHLRMSHNANSPICCALLGAEVSY